MARNLNRKTDGESTIEAQQNAKLLISFCEDERAIQTCRIVRRLAIWPCEWRIAHKGVVVFVLSDR